MSFPAGWYLDPSDPSQQTQRYFDGAAWTQHVAPVTPAPVQPEPVVQSEPRVQPVQTRSLPPLPARRTGPVAAQPVQQPVVVHQPVQQPTVEPPAHEPSSPFGYTAGRQATGQPHDTEQAPVHQQRDHDTHTEPEAPQYGAVPQAEQVPVQDAPKRASMTAGRTAMTAALAVLVGFQLIRMYHRDGGSGLVLFVPILAITLGGVFLWYRKRQSNGAQQVEQAQAAGLLDGATWIGYVQQQPPGGAAINPFTALKPSYLKQFGSGLLAVMPEGLRFLPGEKATKNGHQPWDLPWHLVEAVQEKKAPVGGYVYIGPGGADDMEFAATSLKSGEFTGACARYGADVLG